VHGYQASIVREATRIVAVVAVGFIAANARNATPLRLAAIVAAALAVPVGVAVVQFALNLANFGPQNSADFYRVSGTFVQANKAAQVFVLGAAIGGWMWVARGDRLAGALLAGGSLIALLGTRSMGGLLALVAAAIAYLVLAPTTSPRARGIVIGVVVLSLLVFAISPLGASRIEALQEIRLPWDVVGRTNNSVEWRLYNWWLFLGEWWREPILGHGLGTTLTIVRPIGLVTHSDPVRILVEGGLVGAAVVGLGLVAVTGATRRALRAAAALRGPGSTLVLVITAFLLGIGVQSLAQNTSTNTALLFLLVALLASQWAEPARRAPAADPSPS
ncbi:MAG: O-antigen ligase family protein, partial [Candidatus Limnocylindria bacterium]